jgi:hypothetical protein
MRPALGCRVLSAANVRLLWTRCPGLDTATPQANQRGGMRPACRMGGRPRPPGCADAQRRKGFQPQAAERRLQTARGPRAATAAQPVPAVYLACRGVCPESLGMATDI